MNERILELADSVVIENSSPLNIPDEFCEKFAKLIVKECLNNMENCDGDLDFAIWKTKKDFGVE